MKSSVMTIVTKVQQFMDKNRFGQLVYTYWPILEKLLRSIIVHHASSSNSTTNLTTQTSNHSNTTYVITRHPSNSLILPPDQNISYPTSTDEGYKNNKIAERRKNNSSKFLYNL